MSTTTDLPFGIDVSFWQGEIDWEAVAAHEPPVVFVGIKATEGLTITDAQFERNWSEAKRVSAKRVAAGGLPILRTAYHFLKNTEDPVAQANHFLSVVGSDLGELPLTIDAEDATPASYTVVRDCVYRAAGQVSTCGRAPMIYSRASWVNGFLVGSTDGAWNKAPEWLNTFLWWLAQYLTIAEEYPGLMELPMGVTRGRVLIQQTGDHLPSFGCPGSKMLDYDRWQGDQASLESFYSQLSNGGNVMSNPYATEAKLAFLLSAYTNVNLALLGTFDGIVALLGNGVTPEPSFTDNIDLAYNAGSAGSLGRPCFALHVVDPTSYEQKVGGLGDLGNIALSNDYQLQMIIRQCEYSEGNPRQFDGFILDIHQIDRTKHTDGWIKGVAIHIGEALKKRYGKTVIYMGAPDMASMPAAGDTATWMSGLKAVAISHGVTPDGLIPIDSARPSQPWAPDWILWWFTNAKLAALADGTAGLMIYNGDAAKMNADLKYQARTQSGDGSGGDTGGGTDTGGDTTGDQTPSDPTALTAVEITKVRTILALMK